jgi:hypothetical protein
VRAQHVLSGDTVVRLVPRLRTVLRLARLGGTAATPASTPLPVLDPVMRGGGVHLEIPPTPAAGHVAQGKLSKLTVLCVAFSRARCLCVMSFCRHVYLCFACCWELFRQVLLSPWVNLANDRCVSFRHQQHCWRWGVHLCFCIHDSLDKSLILRVCVCNSDIDIYKQHQRQWYIEPYSVYVAVSLHIPQCQRQRNAEFHWNPDGVVLCDRE